MDFQEQCDEREVHAHSTVTPDARCLEALRRVHFRALDDRFSGDEYI